MSLFRKKETVIDSAGIISIKKKLDILNATPVPYCLTDGFVRKINSAQSFFRNYLKNVSVDDLNDNIFDQYIDSMLNIEIAEGKKQFENHIALIYHIIGLVRGTIDTAERHIECLEHDRKETASEIDKYVKLKEMLEQQKKEGNNDENSKHKTESDKA